MRFNLKDYRKKLRGMSLLTLLHEWEYVRREVNPRCTVWDDSDFTIPKEKKKETVEAIEEVKEKRPVPKCSECRYCEKTISVKRTARNKYICQKKEKDICFGSRENGEMTMRTSPFWCPEREEQCL